MAVPSLSTRNIVPSISNDDKHHGNPIRYDYYHFVRQEGTERLKC
jgi:hypothetical protein